MKQNIETLAQWWTDQITSSSPNSDNGDRSENGALGFILANMIAGAARERMPADAPSKFKALFIERAMKFYEENGREPYMEVDYHPSAFLAEIANEAGISHDAFPCKTYSLIRDGKPYGSCGYSSPLIEL